ncbi:hypothetical protein A2J03_07360 [Rhodococcus sp. EPR-157]|uniref:AAA family ATPase n=1 Tax=Rhodococcus sp. EPR-157 TaxID=1813677 RepID=UPI0007BB3152|nr:AAA family ATPase [Rhodococcus sp. EPR-157]KZF03604.1 hypothetical protein A2J03_07360 [Rhodococcus sp. EPR-157]
MKLKSFRVRVFRNIIDSGEVTADDVTCIVGKNEAGKSALLQALHTLNPANAASNLSMLDEYPRWLKKEHEITGVIDDAVPITATFTISDSELQDIEDTFEPGVLDSREIVASRSYKHPGTLNIEAQINYAAYVDPFINSLPAVLQSAIGSPGTVDKLRALVNECINQKDDLPESVEIAGAARDAAARLAETFGPTKGLRSAIDDLLKELVPRTFYFSTYAQLDGRYDFDSVATAIKNGSEVEAIQTAADFLKLARIAPDAAGDWNFEESNAELESVSSLLTKRVTDQWHQNAHLKLRVSIEAKQVTDGYQNSRIERYLQFRVEDTRHDFSNRLDRRSTGFRWFVSFIAAFLEFEKEADLILLLDEPGLSLHARAQMDLLDTIEDKLAKDRQILYSTHSPFMVRTNSLSRTRIAEDKGPEVGSTVTNDAGMVSDSDTLFPLQAALGYDIVQSLFIGNKNVLVEGVSDYIYLSMISQHLKSKGRASLADDTRLLPAGGATNIPTFISLVGTQLDIVVLLDGNSPRQRIENTIERGRLSSSKILSIADYTDVREADIEDLFAPEEYLKLYNQTYKTRLKIADLNGSDRIVKRIERARTAFDHGEVAAQFLRTLDKSLASLSDETLQRFEDTVKAINAALP